MKHHETLSAVVFFSSSWLPYIANTELPQKQCDFSQSLTAEVTFDWSTLEKPVLDGILRRLFNQLDKDGNGEVPLPKRLLFGLGAPLQ